MADRAGAVAPTFGVRACVHDYSGAVVLRDVDFELRGGAIHALVGENGSGKSTLIKILTGAVQPTGGELYLDEKPLTFGSPPQAQAVGVAVVHQNYNLFLDMSVEHNLLASSAEVPRRGWAMRSPDHAAWRRRVNALFQRLGIQMDPQALVSTLGPAERKFVEIARAMVVEPRFLILDEPTASLEPAAADRVLQLMRTLRDHGVGLAFVSHRLDEVTSVADQISVLRDGRLVESRTAQGLTPAAIAKLMMGERPQESARRTRPEDRSEILVRLRDVQVGTDGSCFDLDVHRREMLAVTGLVGSGAARLVAMLGGAVPLRGAAEIEGRPAKLRSSREAQRHGIGFIPEDRQGRGLVLEQSGAVNISLASLSSTARVGLVSRRRMQERAHTYRTRLGVRMSDVWAPVASLSGGNQQKVMVAKWLASGVRLLAVEEPTQGVDIGGRAQIHELLRDFTDGGGSVVFVSTDVREVLTLADRIAVFRHGRLQSIHPAEQLSMAQLTALVAGQEGEQSDPSVDGSRKRRVS